MSQPRIVPEDLDDQLGCDDDALRKLTFDRLRELEDRYWEHLGDGPGGGNEHDPVGRFRSQCPIKWNYFHAVGDGATKIWTVGDYYIVDYISIYINGLMQARTAHFAQTDPDLGTFTMTQVPRDDDFVDAWYATYCDEDMKPILPIDSDTGKPQAPWEAPGSNPKGTGRCVYICGSKDVGGWRPFFAYTKDIYADSVVWVENSTGLPSTIVGEARITVDPWNPSTTVYLITRVSGDTAEIYKNTAVQTGGSWTKVYDVAQHNSNTGHSDSAIQVTMSYNGSEHSAMLSTIAVPDRYCFRLYDDGGNTYVVHTHDGMATQTEVEIAGISHAAGDERGFAFGQHDADRVWVLDGTNSTDNLYYSTDHGHSFSNLGDMQDLDSLYLPYHDNDDDDVLLGRRSTGGTQMRKSTDNGATWDDWSTDSTSPHHFEVRMAAAGGLGIASNLSTDAYLTNDGAQSWSTTSVSFEILRVALLRPGVYFACGRTNGKEVYTSPDWVNFTSRVGNLHSEVASNPDVYDIVPDWTS